MNEFHFVDIRVDLQLLLPPRISRRSFVSLFGFRTESEIVAEAREIQAKSLAVEAADTALQRREQGRIGAREWIVFRLDPSLNWVLGESLLEHISVELEEYGVRRNPTNPQVLIYSENYAHHFRIIHDPENEIASYDVGGLMSDLKEAELSGFLRHSKVLYEHGRTAFFFTPSENFHDYFIRIGNIQSLPGFAEASFFWSLPHMVGVTHYFAENWSISTTAATFAKMQNAYRADTATRWGFAHSYFPNSVDDRLLLKRELDASRAEAGRFLLLNSFNSTGRLSREFEVLLSGMSEPDAPMLSLFADTATAQPNHEYLLDISALIQELGLKGKEELPISPNVPIFGVDSRTYFPDYRRINVSPFRFSEIEFEKAFFERYSGKGIFSVNRHGRNVPSLKKSATPGEMRHHAFHVDVEKMFVDPDFKHKLHDLLTDRVPATAYLTNSTQASRVLAVACAESVSAELPSILSCGDPGFRGMENVERLSEVWSDSSQNLLVCVPLVITGDTLSNVQIKLRELRKNFGPPVCNISILVGLLRPESSQKLRQLQTVYLRNIDNSEETWIDPVIVESTLLPNWQENRCPWQREKIYLNDLLIRNVVSEGEFFTMSRRVQFLSQSVSSGISDSRVFNVVDDAPLVFNPESLWLDDNQVARASDGVPRVSSEADLCCAVASALQYWRESVAKETWRFNVVDASTVTNLNGYNEARLRAAIWRGLTGEELVNTARAESGSDLKHLLERIFVSEESGENYYPLRMEARLAFRNEIDRLIGPHVSEGFVRPGL